MDDPFFEVHHSGSWMDASLGTTTLSTRKDTVNVETIASVNAVVVHRATEARSGPPASASVSSLVSSRVRKTLGAVAKRPAGAAPTVPGHAAALLRVQILHDSQSVTAPEGMRAMIHTSGVSCQNKREAMVRALIAARTTPAQKQTMLNSIGSWSLQRTVLKFFLSLNGNLGSANAGRVSRFMKLGSSHQAMAGGRSKQRAKRRGN